MNLAENNRRKMKLLILCALVAVAAAGYQPSDVLEGSDKVVQHPRHARQSQVLPVFGQCSPLKILTCEYGGTITSPPACRCVCGCCTKKKPRHAICAKCPMLCGVVRGTLSVRRARVGKVDGKCTCICRTGWKGPLCNIPTGPPDPNICVMEAGPQSPLARASRNLSFPDAQVKPFGRGPIVNGRFASSKFLLLRTLDKKHPCKLQVRCVTTKDYYGSDATTVWMDWCAIAFWTHKNKKRYFRNWVVGQSHDHVLERGPPYLSGQSCQKLPYKFPSHASDIVNLKDLSNKYRTPAGCSIDDPNNNPIYTIHSEGSGNHRNIIFESVCCHWKIKWSPRGRLSKIEIRINPVSRYAGGKDIEGLCNGLGISPYSRDCRKCKPKGQMAPCFDVQDQVFTSCEDYTLNKKGSKKHNWQKHTSGARLTGAGCSGLERPDETLVGCEMRPFPQYLCTKLPAAPPYR